MILKEAAEKTGTTNKRSNIINNVDRLGILYEENFKNIINKKRITLQLVNCITSCGLIGLQITAGCIVLSKTNY